MKGVILHGGHDGRLRSLTHTCPKQLIPVTSKSISQRALEDPVEAKTTEIAFALGNTYPEKVKEHYDDTRA